MEPVSGCWMTMSDHDKACKCTIKDNVLKCNWGTLTKYIEQGRSKPMIYDTPFVSPRPPDSQNSPKKTSRTLKSYNMWNNILSEKPVSVKQPFLISNVHWMSRGHTQQWKWRTSLQRKRWQYGTGYHDGPMERVKRK